MRDFKCGVPFEELCVRETCFEDDDCQGDTVCIYGSCAEGDGLVEIDCPCRFDGQCDSGECDQSLFDLDWKCWDTGLGPKPVGNASDPNFNVTTDDDSVSSGPTTSAILGMILAVSSAGLIALI